MANRNLQIAIIIPIVVSILLLINYFITYSVFSLFGLPKGLLFHLLTIILAVSYVPAMILESKYPSALTKAYYVAAATWLGSITIMLMILVVYYVIRVFFPIANLNAGIAVLSFGVVLTIYGLINARMIKIREHNLEFPKARLKRDLRVVQISDIHLGTINQKPFMQKIADKVNDLKPDVVMMTGDLVDGSAPITLDMVSPINKIKAPIFYVIGNHEIYDGLEFVMPILQKTKMIILRDEVHRWRGMQIAGIDYTGDKKTADKDIHSLKLNKKQFSILLNHEPIEFEEAVKSGVDLMLSGHTHRGQIFPFTLFVSLAYNYVWGLHQLENSFLNISQGTGTWGPPMRLGTDSEICVLNLKSV